MKKKYWIIIILAFIVVGIGIYFYMNKNNSKNSNYETSKISSNSNNTENANNNFENITNTQTENAVTETTQNTTSNNVTEITQNATATKPKKEEEISSFSTTIYTKDSARQTNIEISCNTLNGTIVKNGSTFSFCGTVGQATSAKGYQKADIFDKNGNKTKGLGGRKLSN